MSKLVNARVQRIVMKKNKRKMVGCEQVCMRLHAQASKGAAWGDTKEDDDMCDVDDVSQHAMFHTQEEKEVGASNAPVGTTNDRVRQVRSLAEALFDRVFTDVHPVTTTQSTVPPVRAIQSIAKEMSHADMEGKPVGGSFETKQIIIRVDMRSPSSRFYRFGLANAPSNNLTSLRRVLVRESDLTNTKFNANEMFVGLKQGKVEVTFMSNAGLEKLKDVIKTAKATAAVAAQNGSGLDGSSPPLSSSASSRSSIPSLWSTQFTLHFDTITNTKTAYALLSAMRLSPFVPYPRIITGKVYGFPFTATNEEIESHLKMHAWYIGGAPSLIITRVMQPVSRMYGCPQPRDECFYSVLATEYSKALAIPSLKSTRPLTYHQYTRSKTVVCYHCNKVGHKGSTCAAKEVTNTAGMRDACIMCGSFDHILEACPARDDPNATCIICKKGKHTVRACPEYRGTYKTIIPRKLTRSAWTGRKWMPVQTQLQEHTQPQLQSQSQTHAQQQHTQACIPQQNQYNTQIEQQGKMIEMLVSQNNTMQTTITSLMEQITTLSQLLSSYVTQINTSTKKGGLIMYDDDSTDVDTTQTAPAKKAKTGSNKNKTPPMTTKSTSSVTTTNNKTQQAINKTQNDITSGTPRVNSFFQPSPNTDATRNTNNTTTQGKESMQDDATTTTVAALNTFMSVPTPITKVGKRGRTGREEAKTNEKDDAPRSAKETALFTLGAKEKEKGRGKEKLNE
jgi:hypothetical protein